MEKQNLIDNYHTKGFNNCIGSVERVVDELFDNIEEVMWEYIPNGCLQTQHLYKGRLRNRRTGEWKNCLT